MLTFGVLGPVTAVDPRGPVDLRGLRHRAVLARLLIARGRVVPVRRLADDLWAGQPPEGAVGAIQTFVSALRRALEPDRPPRSPARVLVTVAPGYALRAAEVDAWRFEAELDAAAGRHPREALDRLDAALGLWRGPAYAEFAEEDWARGEVARLGELRLLAVERRAGAVLALGGHERAVADLEAHVSGHPWREEGWRLLALALYRAGRQGEALGTLRRARGLLVAELGVDPGPELRRLEADILAHAPDLAAGPVREKSDDHAGVPAGIGPTSDGVTHSGRGATGRTGGPAGEFPPDEPDAGSLVGRDAELGDLVRAATAVRTRGLLGLALVVGEPGAGKTALCEALAETLGGRGWTVAWGRSPESAGVPAGWPWLQVLAALAAAGHGSGPDPERGAGDDPAAARFRAHRAAGEHLAAVAATGPVLLVFDDLHFAGEETLDLLAALVAGSVPGPVLVVGAYRDGPPPPALAGALARFARAEPARIHLDGLSEPAVGVLIRAAVGREVTARTVRAVHTRSGGNPFYVRELARLLDSGGDAALSAVPPGVRDVVRHRLAQLPAAARTVLARAAVVGRDVDLDLLVPLVGDEDAVLDAVDAALLMGFLVTDDPGGLRFAHALVRDTVYGDVSLPRRARWHAAVAETLERLRPTDSEALAWHFIRADSPATAGRAAYHAGIAAARAERRAAPHEAARLWRAAVAAHDRADRPDGRARLDAVMGVARALALTGDLEAARRARLDAIGEAERLGDPVRTARVIGAFEVPAIWTRVDDPEVARQVAGAATRALAALEGADGLAAPTGPEDRADRSGSAAPVRADSAVDGDSPAPVAPGTDPERVRLLCTLALELRGVEDPRGPVAATRAEALARRLDDPALLAFALNARFMHTFGRTGLAPERAAIGADIVALAGTHDLVTFEVLGHLICQQAHAALADLGAADLHAGAADRLAHEHDLPLVGVFTAWHRALKLAVAGRTTEAGSAYRDAAGLLTGAGMWGLEQGILPLALLCLRGGEPSAVDRDADYGPYRPWTTVLGLVADGDLTGARAALRLLPDAPPDLLREALDCLAATAALSLDDHPRMSRLYAELLPAAGELAGAGSGLVTLGPVAQWLGDLARALGRPREAATHYRRAADVAMAAGAPQRVVAAENAARR